MKIAHVSMLKAPLESSRGFRNQLQSEWLAARDLDNNSGLKWRTILLVPEGHGEHNYVDFGPEVRKIPRRYTNRMVMRLYLWKTVRELARANDFVLVRHSMVDPIGTFASMGLGNVFSVHHTNGVSELSGSGATLASGVERVLMKINRLVHRRAIGVTPELWRYATGAPGRGATPIVYPNGIDLSAIDALPERSIDRDLAAVFVASKFFRWHGLEKLIEASRGYTGTSKFDVHLVGTLSGDQEALLSKTPRSAVTFHQHGTLYGKDLESLASACDVGIGSLDLKSKDMEEACTLKIREYLAWGLPVYACHRDSGLPADFEFFKDDVAPDIGNLIAFAAWSRSVSRAAVRASAAPHISKVDCMLRLAEVLGGGADEEPI